MWCARQDFSRCHQIKLRRQDWGKKQKGELYLQKLRYTKNRYTDENESKDQTKVANKTAQQSTTEKQSSNKTQKKNKSKSQNYRQETEDTERNTG